jgi:hypothetical protein
MDAILPGGMSVDCRGRGAAQGAGAVQADWRQVADLLATVGRSSRWHARKSADGQWIEFTSDRDIVPP